MQSWIIAALLFSGVSGIRKQRRSASNVTTQDLEAQDLEAQNSRGQVANLVLFGAPMIARPALTNPMRQDGCFPGYRIVNKQRGSRWSIDIVPPVLRGTVFKHPKMDVEFLDDQGKESQACGWTGNSRERASMALHEKDLYVERTVARLPAMRSAAEVGLAVSYEHRLSKASRFVEGFGFRLVGSALVGDEASHLIQNPRTGDCLITFEGSDSIDDWIQNIQIFQGHFCGLSQRVHNGFKRATNAMVRTSQFNEGVRAKLGHCRKVDAVGHSRGGAIAALFTACAHNTVQQGGVGYREWEHYWWTKKATKIMDSVA